MSVQKPTGVVASMNMGMMVGDGKHHRRAIAHIRLWGVIMFCALVLVSAACAVYYLKKSPKSSGNSAISAGGTQQSVGGLPAGFSSFSPDQKAQYYTLAHNYAAADNAYMAELKSTTTSSEKSSIYMNLGTDALDAKNFEQAYNYGLQADAADPSYETAQFVASAAQMNNDKKDAAKYYQLAINRLGSLNLPQANYEYDLDQLQQSLSKVSN